MDGAKIQSIAEPATNLRDGTDRNSELMIFLES
jgi:hypothetical protein